MHLNMAMEKKRVRRIQKGISRHTHVRTWNLKNSDLIRSLVTTLLIEEKENMQLRYFQMNLMIYCGGKKISIKPYYYTETEN